jgi:hypothetical protein
MLKKLPSSFNAWKGTFSFNAGWVKPYRQTGRSFLMAKLSLNTFLALCLVNIKLGASEEMVYNIIFVTPNRHSLCVYRCIGTGISENS